MLLFLLPLIAAYEIGAAFFLTEAVAGQIETIRAYRIISDVFRFLGAVGSPIMEFVPSALILVVLFAWHILNRDRWRVRPKVVLGMFAESIAWAIPLIVLLQLVTGITGGLAAAAQTAVPGGLDGPGGGLGGGLPPASLAVISVGAGLYEELLFRLLGVTLLHLLIVDFLGVKQKAGTIIAIAASALFFALYHDRSDLAAVTTYVIAGIYFGIVFVYRGFGITVATHAGYNLAVTVLLPMMTARSS